MVTAHLVRRLLLAIPVLLVVSILIFGAVRIIPGDVCRLVLQSPEVTEEQCARVDRELGLDKPAPRNTSTGWAACCRATSASSNLTKRARTSAKSATA